MKYNSAFKYKTFSDTKISYFKKNFIVKGTQRICANNRVLQSLQYLCFSTRKGTTLSKSLMLRVMWEFWKFPSIQFFCVATTKQLFLLPGHFHTFFFWPSLHNHRANSISFFSCSQLLREFSSREHHELLLFRQLFNYFIYIL